MELSYVKMNPKKQLYLLYTQVQESCQGCLWWEFLFQIKWWCYVGAGGEQCACETVFTNESVIIIGIIEHNILQSLTGEQSDSMQAEREKY